MYVANRSPLCRRPSNMQGPPDIEHIFHAAPAVSAESVDDDVAAHALSDPDIEGVVHAAHVAPHRTRSQQAYRAQLARVRAATARAKTARSGKLEKLSDSWDVLHGLRECDRVDRGVDRVGPDGKRMKLHTEQWNFENSLGVGWQQVGKRNAYRRGIGETTHGIQAALCLASITERAQEKYFADELFSAVEADPTLGLVIRRHHDATPAVLHYGLFSKESYTNKHGIQSRKMDVGRRYHIPST